MNNPKQLTPEDLAEIAAFAEFVDRDDVSGFVAVGHIESLISHVEWQAKRIADLEDEIAIPDSPAPSSAASHAPPSSLPPCTHPSARSDTGG